MDTATASITSVTEMSDEYIAYVTGSATSGRTWPGQRPATAAPRRWRATRSQGDVFVTGTFG